MLELTKGEVDELLSLLDYVLEDGGFEGYAKQQWVNGNFDEKGARERINGARQTVFNEYTKRTYRPLRTL